MIQSVYTKKKGSFQRFLPVFVIIAQKWKRKNNGQVFGESVLQE